MKILITGIAGFIGSRFAEWLLKNVSGCEIIGVDDFSSGYSTNIPNHERLTSHCASLGREQRHGGGLLDAVAPVDYVFHFAAYPAEGLSPFIRVANYAANLLATAEVVNYCIRTRVKRLVFASSIAVYGWNGPAPFRESTEPRPIDPYGVAKLASELDIKIAGYQHGLNWCILRLHNVYGPGQCIWNPYRNVFGIWMMEALKGLPFQVYGNGQQRRAFTYIDDCLHPLWRAATSPDCSEQVINLGSSHLISVLEVARKVRCVTARPTATGLKVSEIEHVGPRHEATDAWCSTGKSRRLLGFKESIELREGLSLMWEYAKKAHKEFPRRKHVPPELEINTGLPSFWKGKQND